MFSSVVQPPILSLFSSTSTDCLSLFSTHTDPELPSDSFVHVLDDETSLPEPPAPQTLMKTTNLTIPDEVHDVKGAVETSELTCKLSLSGPVLHIQSPTLPNGYIHSPPLHWKPDVPRRARDLDIKLGWLHMQVRNMGRAWSFEVGVVDVSGREGRVRCSTFQRQPRLGTRTTNPPLLHIPVKFPAHSSRPLTEWCTISLHLPEILPLFTSVPSQTHTPQALFPTGQFSHVSYVRVYANCRLRRIWFTTEKRDAATEPWEFGLYSN